MVLFFTLISVVSLEVMSRVLEKCNRTAPAWMGSPDVNLQIAGSHVIAGMAGWAAI